MAKVTYKIYNVIALLCLTYFLNNCSIPLSGSETSTFKIYEYTKRFFSDKIESTTDGKWSLYKTDYSWNKSITLISTSFDLTLVDYYGGRDFPQGKVAITDRKDLYDFLKIAYQEGTYKYIIVDIALDEKGTIYDDSIARLIPQMNNIVVARSRKFGLTDSLLTKSGWVDYYKMPYETGFVKYDFGTNERQSLALRIYNESNKRNAITSICGLLFFDGLRLCKKTSPLDYDIRFILQENDTPDSQKIAGIYAYQNLGTDFQDDTENDTGKITNIEKVKKCINDKIVVIGDFLGNDIHETYVGKMSGALINLNAYLTLQKGGHLVNIFHVILLFIFYFILYMIIEYRNKLSLLIGVAKIGPSDFLQIIVSVVGWGTLFNIIALVLYLFFDTFFNPWIPTLWFTFVPQFIKVYKSIKLSKK